MCWATRKIPSQLMVPPRWRPRVGGWSSRIRSFPRWEWVEGQVGGWVGKPPGRREEELSRAVLRPSEVFLVLSPNSSHLLHPFPLPPLNVTTQVFRAPTTEGQIHCEPGTGGHQQLCACTKRFPGMKYCFPACGSISDQAGHSHLRPLTRYVTLISEIALVEGE